MNIEEIQAHIETFSDSNEELVRTYLKLSDLSNLVDSLKAAIIDYVGENLEREEKRWDECDEATFGITDPKPKAKVDEKAWKEAVEESEELTRLNLEYTKARFPFMIDATLYPRPYIRRKGRS